MGKGPEEMNAGGSNIPGGGRNGIGEGGICPLGLQGPGDSAVVLGTRGREGNYSATFVARMTRELVFPCERAGRAWGRTGLGHGLGVGRGHLEWEVPLNLF